MTVIEIKTELPWFYRRTKTGCYVAVCEPLAQTLQADSYSELIASIRESIESTFKELLVSGDLHEFLRERGWKSTKIPDRRGRVDFDVPFQLNRMSRRDSQVALCK